MLRRTLGHAALIFACVCGTSTLTPDARAQDKKTLSQARAKFQQAIELEHAGDWAGALQLFREVGSVRMTPQVRYHIAACEEKLGKLVAALGGYELALADSEEMAEGFVEEVQSSVESLKARIPKLVIKRGEGARAASVELDGVSLGNSSIGVDVPIDPGPHTIAARAPGYESFSQTVDVAEEERRTVTVTLTPVDSGEQKVAVGVGAPTSAAPPANDGPKFRILPYVIGGAGGVFLLGSGVSFFLHQQEVAWLEDHCPNNNCRPEVVGSDVTSEARDRHSKAETLSTVGWVTLGVGIVAVGTGATLYFLDQNWTQEVVTLPGGVAVQGSAPGADVAGLSVTGAF